MARVLLIEDDALFVRALRRGLELHGHAAAVASTGMEGLERAVRERPDVVLLDLYLGHGDLGGLDVLDRVRGLYPGLPVIIMTGYGTVESAVEAMKKGASDYIQKPLNIQEVLFLVERALEVANLRQEVHYLRLYQDEVLRLEPVVAHSESMRRVVDLATRVARSEARNVLLCGESGAGKDVIARLIHLRSPRAARHYVVVNCAALPEPLVEVELFGVEANALPGASQERRGRFELADGGTLLLDQVGAMSLEIQAKLLRVLDDRRVCRVGGTRETLLDVRILATSNEDLADAVALGRLRPDLYHRLNLVRIDVPPLRERREDVLPLALQFLRELGGAGRQRSISPAAASLLARHRWPGNARELRNLVERVLLLHDPDCIEPEHLRGALDLGGQDQPTGDLRALASLAGQQPAGEVYERIMRLLLIEALRRAEGNQAEACRWLGLSRSRLTYRMRQLGIDSRRLAARGGAEDG
ncbi:MAG: sigma-54 dependent transcriptional regulator [Candidatus Latescibacterota bacterium]